MEHPKIHDSLRSARRTIELEAQAIAALAAQLTDDFEAAVRLLLHMKGKAIVCGMGKSGHIARKIAATLASTGTPSFFLHPAEALHGDLGMVGPGDVLLLISYSGETEEVLRLLPHLKTRSGALIALTGNQQSTLARHADCCLNVQVPAEACPLSLAPTASTTASLVMGDALAIALMEARQFRPEDFAHYHPGGSIGKRLLGRVKDYARYHDLPFLPAHATAKELIACISEGRLGLVLIAYGERTGIITDGDLRRQLAGVDRLSDIDISSFINYQPLMVDEELPVYKAEELMLQRKITTLLVQRNQRVAGVFQLYYLT
jgi:arabinose-5-phosphate isomerase